MIRNDDEDEPILTPALAAHIARVAAMPDDPAARAAADERAAAAWREAEAAKHIPRLSISEIAAKLNIQGKGMDEDGDAVREFRMALRSYKPLGNDHQPIIDDAVHEAMVDGFVSLIKAFDKVNHPPAGEEYQSREAANQAALALRDRLLEFPHIAACKSMAEGLTGFVIGKAAPAAARLGITMPKIRRNLFMMEPSSPVRS